MSRSHYYRLNGHIPEPCSASEWAEWLELSIVPRTVGRTQVGIYEIVTIFHGFDPATLFGRERPLLFGSIVWALATKKLIFPEELCSTWWEAELIHHHRVQTIKTLYVRERP